jgi:peptide/nickel transport system permease protein
MNALRYILRRLAWSLLVVWFVVTAAFAMVTLIPADPAKAMLGPHATPETIERVREHYCLDRGFAGQYACFVERIAHGDLGESYRSKRPVGELILDRLGPTVQLALATILLQLLVGLPLGIAAAARRGRWPDRAANLASLLGQSLPTFFVGTLLVYVLAYGAGWFPIGGYGSGVLDRLHHLVLPTLTLATLGIAYYARLVRGELIDTLGEDYIRTARAKGLPERRVLVRHALPVALGPVIALIGIDLGVLLGGTVVTEYIFAWPGLGREVLQAILEVDLPLILGVVMVSAFAIAVANLIADLVHVWIDPRLRDGS